jgi:hypothetical protein
MTRGLRCSPCGRGKEDVTQLIVGPDIYICDRCVNDANRHLLVKEKGGPPARCSYCEEERPAPHWEQGGYRVCSACLEMFNQILYEAIGPDGLIPEVRSSVAKLLRRRQREIDLLERSVLARHHTSLATELLTVNLRLLSRNAEEIASHLERPEARGAIRHLTTAERRRLAKAMKSIMAALGPLPDAR